MELIKSQVKGHFVLGSDVDCSPLSVVFLTFRLTPSPSPGLEV
jgi:hypothetical protein